MAMLFKVTNQSGRAKRVQPSRCPTDNEASLNLQAVREA